MDLVVTWVGSEVRVWKWVTAGASCGPKLALLIACLLDGVVLATSVNVRVAGFRVPRTRVRLGSHGESGQEVE